MKMEQGTQLIDGNGKFNVDGLKDFMTATEFAQSGLSYAIVAIIGSQSSGKSTLMNQTFHTNFEEMDAYNGRGQTTKGIWIAKCSDIDPFTIAMDFEGTDSNQRGEDDTAFEKQSTLFALAIADVVLINMWYKDIGLEHAASRPLLKTVFQVMKRLFKPRKKTLLFVLRDHSKVEITALPHYEYQDEKFKEQVARLRQRFVHSIYPGGLVGDREEVEPASGFPLRAEEIWKIIKDNRDLDLPAVKVMVATVRCEEIAGEKLKCFTFDEDWLKMKKTVQDCPVSGFGGAVSSILETYLSEYDREVVYFDQEVRNAKRRLLLSNALMVVRDAYDTMLMHLYSNTVNRFKTSLEQSQSEGQQYVAAIHFYSQSCMREFDQGCEDAAIQQSEWNGSKFREKLICDMLSEMMAKYKKRITRALAKRVESLLEAGERDTWASIRNLFECTTEAAVSEFSDAVVSFNLNSSEIDTKSQHLREHARNLLEMKAREAAAAGRVLRRMKYRFSHVLGDYEKSMSWYNWTEEKNLDEVERNALSESLRILSIMAAMRFDEMPDQIEKVLYSSLMDRAVPDPSLPNTFMGASDTWEEDGRRRTRRYAAAAAGGAAAAAAAGVGAAVVGPAAVVDAGIVIFMRAMRLGSSILSLREVLLVIIKNGVQPASGFPLRAEQIRKTIKENKDLDLPAMEVMIATFRWEQITKETLSRLKSDKTGPEPKFRKKLISILKNSLSQHDMEATHFKESIRDEKRQELEIEALKVLHLAYVDMLRHLHYSALKSFMNRLVKRVKEASRDGFEASIDHIVQDAMHQFEKGCKDVSSSQGNSSL
ncbi:protein ROOT HAIR DEFECTIVE 3 [Populus alba x Populus x berolinensis]|uniref:Protein ROOT HAIR DEFECTIVE 3 n=1 Tax=Populus alba x Populus x berolinensis TaxID=444605 RepID=A0AAD6M2Z3_9ROSI|nr:protein ROOT HAIR DEFECTIVE 3 [Populus alba x Populus x berolinensis]